MSSLTVNTITDGVSSVPSTTVIKGASKSWVSLNGTGVIAVLGSHNVTSITDNGTGDYSTQLVSVIANANYAATVTGQAVNTSNGSQVWPMLSASASPTTSTYRYVFQSMGAGGATYTLVDAARACGVLHGDHT